MRFSTVCGLEQSGVKGGVAAPGFYHLWRAFLLCLLCTGCIPIRYTTSPGAFGTIVDAKTRVPVGGAEVVISRSTYPPPSLEKAFANGRLPVVTSMENGQFAIPLERRFDLYFAPVDLFPRFGLLVVRHPGYQSSCLPFWSHSVADLGEIKMKPLGAP